MLWIVILLALVCLLLAGYIAALLLEVRRMTDTLTTVAETDTNSQVYTLTRNRQLRAMACAINAMLASQRKRARKIKKADAAFKESVTGISHDLRTPLTSVSGYLQLLESEKTPPEKRAEYLHIIEGRLAALLTLLDELFEYTRLETDEESLRPERVNLSAAVLEQLALYYEEFTGRGIAPDISVPDEAVSVFCDRKSLERIFQNLIKNALVHGEGRVSVSLAVEGGEAQLCFANAAAQVADPERLFDRFYTGDKSRSGKSTGLGLAIVKQLTGNVGGAVDADYAGGMLRITLRFPTA